MFTAFLFDAIKRYIQYRTQLLCIEQLDDRTLQDIGFTRVELCAEVWQRAARAAI